MNILSPLKINNIILPNRITVASMCQYSAKNGNPSTWHYGHLQQLANSGAGMLMLESTAVEMNGRITLKDLALANKENENSLKNLVKYIRTISKIPLGLQISHAGRKGSAEIPWIKSNHPLSRSKKKWKTYAPSAIRRGAHWPIPGVLTISQIKKITNDFKSSAKRAKRIGFDCLEIHMAHGYLLHEFFSPISNKRKDNYGGTLENRCKLLIEIIQEIRKIWPKKKILGARVTGQDWLKNGSTINDCVYLVKKLKKAGIDYVCVSSGGILSKPNIIFKPGYQVHLAKEIKKRTGVITRTTGMITKFDQAKKIINSGSADIVNMARKFIKSPTWLINTIKKKNKKIEIPGPYKRCL
jgi:2,4-dienoyl-CoA reductase-like NADH-dependent reductase (Old Yellow Enzyme family)